MTDRPWYLALWALADATLRRWAESLQRLLRTLRLVRALLFVGLAWILASGVLAVLAAAGLIDLKWFLAAHAVAAMFLAVPLAALAVLAGLPLRARSVVRLVDMGYPANARELLIRLFARKLRDESIETEELLVEAAVNEARKAFRRMEEARHRRGAGDRPDPPGPPPAPPPAPPPSPPPGAPPE